MTDVDSYESQERRWYNTILDMKLRLNTKVWTKEEALKEAERLKLDPKFVKLVIDRYFS